MLSLLSFVVAFREATGDSRFSAPNPRTSPAPEPAPEPVTRSPNPEPEPEPGGSRLWAYAFGLAHLFAFVLDVGSLFP